jgi:hypothetical protein
VWGTLGELYLRQLTRVLDGSARLTLAAHLSESKKMNFKILTNEKKAGLKAVAFDRSPYSR